MQVPLKPKKRTPWRTTDDMLRPLYEIAFGKVRKRAIPVDQATLIALLSDFSALCQQLGE